MFQIWLLTPASIKAKEKSNNNGEQIEFFVFYKKLQSNLELQLCCLEQTKDLHSVL